MDTLMLALADHKYISSDHSSGWSDTESLGSNGPKGRKVGKR